MKVAVVGSRGLQIPIPENAVPAGTTQLVSGAANGIDRMARAFAIEHHIQILEVLPDYALFGRQAPLQRNDAIVDYADFVLAIWDGRSRGTKYVIDRCRATGTPVRVLLAGADGSLTNMDEK